MIGIRNRKQQLLLQAPPLQHVVTAGAFARRIAARYLHLRAGWRQIHLSLVNARPVILQYVQRRYLSMVVQTPRAILARHERVTITLKRYHRDEPVRDTGLFWRTQAAPAAFTRAGNLLVHIVQRTRRIEADARGGPVAGGSPKTAAGTVEPRITPDQALPLVVPATVPMAAPERPADVASSPERRRWSVSPADGAVGSNRPHAPALFDGDIERLAERVISSIDRRIAAQRERLGRP